MRKSRLLILTFVLASLTGTLYAQFGYRRNFGPTPGQPPPGEQAEWTFARLAYDSAQGERPMWDVDYPGAEEHFSEAVGRLTRINPHETGYVVSPDFDDMFDYPWIYAVEPWTWSFSTDQAARMREYLLRGGFMMVDDFHGSDQWAGFVSVMQRVFPDRPIVDIQSDDEVFHVLYDLDERIQIPGLAALYNGTTYEGDGVEPTWRGIYDDDGRLIVAINHNMDLGDAWEHADTPGYPEPMTALAYRFAVNYVIYSMTH
jgi:hypothetical protein